jgi:plasmid stabilization system protein ParE
VALRIRFTASARRQIGQADRWWREHRSKAPGAIREELQRVTDLIAIRPLIGSPTTLEDLERVRRIHIERIHYDVYYRIISKPAQIEIVAFWSSFRGSLPPA